MFNSKLTSKLIASSLLIAGIAGLAPKAMAQSANADFVFSGTVADTCLFSSASYTGGLTENTTTKTLSSSTPISTSFMCNKSGKTLTLNSINPDISNPAPANSLSVSATISGSNTGSINTIGGTTTLSNIGTTNVAVGMTATFANPITAGNYKYTVTMTLTP